MGGNNIPEQAVQFTKVSKQQCIKKTQTTKFPDYNTQKLDAARQIQEFLLSREQPGDFWE